MSSADSGLTRTSPPSVTMIVPCLGIRPAWGEGKALPALFPSECLPRGVAIEVLGNGKVGSFVEPSRR